MKIRLIYYKLIFWKVMLGILRKFMFMVKVYVCRRKLKNLIKIVLYVWGNRFELIDVWGGYL